MTLSRVSMQQEAFKPPNHAPPDSPVAKVTFYGRLLLDLQMLTIFRDLRRTLPSFQGKVLDVGCGQSPYRFLLNAPQVEYFGIDIADASKFGYENPNVTYFNGEEIPFVDDMFDGVICTEVLEHVQNYQTLVNEIRRVMKPGARAVVTIPWSARFHYIPHDYFRYTPSSLATVFEEFSEVVVAERGSDISNIASKVIVVWMRNIATRSRRKRLLVPLWVVTSPVALAVMAIAHVSLLWKFGSEDDPLGYTIFLKK